MIKVLERIALWLGTPILAIMFWNYSLLILGIGAVLIILTLPPKALASSASANDDSEREARSAPARKRSRPEDPTCATGETEEEFLARMRYQEQCETH